MPSVLQNAITAIENSASIQASASLHRAVETVNEAISARNRQIQVVLASTTGQEFAPELIPWWNWWQNYNETYFPGSTASESDDNGCQPAYDHNTDKPHYDYTYSYTRPVYIICTCLARGTSVWTLTGPQAIETIKPGDRVLSQDPDSGELAYKPVLATTYRPPSRRLVIGIGAEKITTTLGHPFWVANEGWRMAKELKVGLRLHGLDGAVTVESLEGTAAPLPWYEGAYNLVVADFNTYFVGKHLLLVHDNTPRRPPAVAVPALLRYARAPDEGKAAPTAVK